MCNASEYVVNPYLATIRLSPTEVILSHGVFSKSYIHLSFDVIDKCDHVQELLEKRMAEPAPLEAIRREFTEAGCTEEEIEHLLQTSVLVPVQFKPTALLWSPDSINNIESRPRSLHLVTEGCLGQIVQAYLERLEVTFEVRKLSLSDDAFLPSDSESPLPIVVLVIDYWAPQLLRTIESRCRQQGIEFVPVFLVQDGGVIGPHMTPHSAGYLSFERQVEASLTSWLTWRAWRDKWLSAQGKSVFPKTWPEPFITLIGSLASILLAQLACGNHILINRAVVVDFPALFIDVVRVYRTWDADTINMLRGEF